MWYNIYIDIDQSSRSFWYDVSYLEKLYYPLQGDVDPIQPIERLYKPHPSNGMTNKLWWGQHRNHAIEKQQGSRSWRNARLDV